jgi:hypothetical protein
LRTTISGIEVQGTPEEMDALICIATKRANEKDPPAEVPTATTTRGQSRAEKHACDLCDRVFERSKSLTNHKNRVHGNGEKRPSGAFPCKGCDRSFKNKQGLHHHQTITGHTRREISSPAGPSSAHRNGSPGPSAEQSTTASGDLAVPNVVNHSAGLTTAKDAQGDTKAVRRFLFICKTGPTDTKHCVEGPTPELAIQQHDLAYPNHQFLTAHEERVDSRNRHSEVIPLVVA